MAGTKTLTFTDSAFEAAVLKSEKPVLVDFWAEWCGPCRQMTPAIDAVAESFDSRVDVGKLNIVDNPETASRYGITSIPALLVFKAGKIVEQRVGAMGKTDLETMLNRHL